MTVNVYAVLLVNQKKQNTERHDDETHKVTIWIVQTVHTLYYYNGSLCTHGDLIEFIPYFAIFIYNFCPSLWCIYYTSYWWVVFLNWMNSSTASEKSDTVKMLASCPKPDKKIYQTTNVWIFLVKCKQVWIMWTKNTKK